MNTSISKKQLFFYALGEVGFILAVNSFDSYITYFLTDIALMTPMVMAIILFISRIGDFISVPITGALVEKANMKNGKLRPWLIICPALMLIVILICFSNPTNISLSVRGIIIIVAYTLYGFVKNTLYTAYLAMPTTLSKNPDSRMNLSVRRSQFNAAAKIMQGLVAMPLVLTIGNGNEAKGYFWMMTIMAMCLVAFFSITYFSCKEDPEILKNYQAQGRATIGEMLSQAVKNKPLLILTFSELCRWLHLFFMYSTAVYYYNYVVNDLGLYAVFFTAMNICLLVGTFIGGRFISKKLHSIKTYNIGMLLLGVFTTLAFIGSNSSLFVTVCICIGNIGFGFSNCVVIAMFNDTAVYGEWKTGKNISGFVTSFYSIAIILASVLISPIVGGTLTICHYEAGAALTTSVSFGLRALMTLFPGIIVLIGYIVNKFNYKLTDSEIKNYQNEIDNRANKILNS